MIFAEKHWSYYNDPFLTRDCETPIKEAAEKRQTNTSQRVATFKVTNGFIVVF